MLAHLTLNMPDYYGDMTQRELAIELAGYLARRLEDAAARKRRARRACSASWSRNQRLG